MKQKTKKLIRSTALLLLTVRQVRIKNLIITIDKQKINFIYAHFIVLSFATHICFNKH